MKVKLIESTTKEDQSTLIGCIIGALAGACMGMSVGVMGAIAGAMVGIVIGGVVGGATIDPRASLNRSPQRDQFQRNR